MNVFETVKASVSVPEAARAYGLIEDRVTRACEEERRSDNAGKINAAS